jgi:hypothetical protein
MIKKPEIQPEPNRASISPVVFGGAQFPIRELVHIAAYAILFGFSILRSDIKDGRD